MWLRNCFLHSTYYDTLPCYSIHRPHPHSAMKLLHIIEIIINMRFPPENEETIFINLISISHRFKCMVHVTDVELHSCPNSSRQCILSINISISASSTLLPYFSCKQTRAPERVHLFSVRTILTVPLIKDAVLSIKLNS